jgi:predicted ATP-dependent serine protease
MTKTRVRYVCQSCGAFALKWSGQCKECGEWNTLVETAIESHQDAHPCDHTRLLAHRCRCPKFRPTNSSGCPWL